MFYLLWVTALVFTLCAFIWRDQFFFPLISFTLWNAMAILVTSIDFIGFGSINIITYTMDPNVVAGTSGLMWIFHGLGIAMMVYGVGNLLRETESSLKTLTPVYKGV